METLWQDDSQFVFLELRETDTALIAADADTGKFLLDFAILVNASSFKLHSSNWQCVDLAGCGWPTLSGGVNNGIGCLEVDR